MKTVIAKFPQMVSLKNVLVLMGIWNPVLKKVLQYSNNLFLATDENSLSFPKELSGRSVKGY